MKNLVAPSSARAARLVRVVVLSSTVLLGACSSAAAPGATQPPTPTAGATIDSPAAAANAVLASDTRFGKLGAFDPNVIGQCCGYRVAPSGDGWTVTVEVGWGDCPAGCIDRHQWVYDVDRTGRVVLQRESGPQVPPGLPGSGAGGTTAGTPAPTDDGTGPTTTQGIRGTATAGPTCPVVRPSDPACNDRPVAGATVHIASADGVEVATVTTDAGGRFAVDLEPGTYTVKVEPVTGMMRSPEAISVTVPTGVATVQLAFDTGIR